MKITQKVHTNMQLFIAINNPFHFWNTPAAAVNVRVEILVPFTEWY
jgi:hypothetical protein